MKILKPLPIPNEKKLKKLKNNFYVLDTETTKLEPMPENFVFGVIYGYNYVFTFYNINDFLLEIRKPRFNKKIIFAHNAEFDLLTLFGNLYQNLDQKTVFNGKFISAKFGSVMFADSLNIFPASVATIGDKIGKHKIENEKVKTEGLNKNNITEDDINYCIRDCEIIYDSLLNIFEFTGKVKITLAGIAMNTFRSKFLGDNLMYSDLNDEFYNSYYGGRTEAFYIGKTDNLDVYDVNSEYPFVMLNTYFPDIKNLKKEITPSIEYLLYCLKRYEGQASVKIHHNDTYFGFIPKKSEKLLFPVGVFSTIVNFNELRFALKHNAIKILSCEYLIYGNPIKSPFKDFINSIYKLRSDSQNDFEKYFLKLIMNSLYGRFAMRTKYQTEYFDLIPYEIISELKNIDTFYSLKLFNQKRTDCFLITESESMKNSFFAIPTFSSYITSAARILILEHLIKNNHTNKEVFYCDTDSIFVKKDLEFIGEIGNEIGKFKKENKLILDIRGLKNYTYLDLSTNEIKDSIKGISKRAVKVVENDKTLYKTTQYYKTKESLRQDKEAGSKKEVIKELKHTYDKRIILNDGFTKPIKLNEK